MDPVGHSLEFKPFFIDCDLDNDLLQQTECRSDAEPVPWLPFRGLAAFASSSWNICFLEPWAPHSLPGWRDYVKRLWGCMEREWGPAVSVSWSSPCCWLTSTSWKTSQGTSRRTTQRSPATHRRVKQHVAAVYAPCVEAVGYAASLTNYATPVNHKTSNKKQVNWLPQNNSYTNLKSFYGKVSLQCSENLG